MIKITSLELLLKQSGLLDSLFSAAKIHFDIKINGKSSFTSPEATIKDRFAKWKAYDLNTGIQIPHTQQKNYEVHFYFYRGSAMMGWAKSLIVMGHNRKDCLDIIDNNYTPIAKCTYNIQWINGSIQNQYNYLPNVYANEALKEYEQPQKEYAKMPPLHDYERQPRQEKKPNNNSGILSSFMGCFGCASRIKKPLPLRITLANVPLQYEDQQLEYAPPSEMNPYQIQYYSKKFPIPQIE